MFERDVSFFMFEKESRPMSEDRFADVELAIRSLRDIPGEALVVAFVEWIDKLKFIQAVSVDSYKFCHIELGFLREGKEFPQLLSKDEVPVEQVVSLFRNVCCTRQLPDLSDWEDITQYVLEQNGEEDI